MAVLSAVGDHQGELGGQLADPDDAVEALVPVLNNHLSVGGVLAVGGLKSDDDIADEKNLVEGEMFLAW